jgi:membrane-associated phospholipid phosphatase
VALTLAAPAAAWAAPGDGELHVNRTVSASFSLGGVIAYVLSESSFKDDLAPTSCRWCRLNSLDRGVRDRLLWDDTQAARSASNATGYMGAPLAGFGLLALASWHDDRTEQMVDDELIVLEAVLATALLNQGVKFLAGRERPFVRALSADQKGMTPDPYDNNLSFFSGHTSFTFSIAVASGTVASLRGYRLAPWIWGSGLTLAATTGYLRIAGDKHYFTDVITGALVGSFVGFAVPYWLHRGASSGSEASASTIGAAWSGGGPLLSWSGSF